MAAPRPSSSPEQCRCREKTILNLSQPAARPRRPGWPGAIPPPISRFCGSPSRWPRHRSPPARRIPAPWRWRSERTEPELRARGWGLSIWPAPNGIPAAAASLTGGSCSMSGLPATRKADLVFDTAGACLGMSTFGPRGQVIAIPTATIERIVPLLLKGGRIPRGWLGVALGARPGRGARCDCARPPASPAA